MLGSKSRDFKPAAGRYNDEHLPPPLGAASGACALTKALPRNEFRLATCNFGHTNVGPWSARQQRGWRLAVRPAARVRVAVKGQRPRYSLKSLNTDDSLESLRASEHPCSLEKPWNVSER